MKDYNNIQPIPGIYKITNTVNGKFYIGSSVNCKNRWHAHISTLRRNKHHNPLLQNAFNKYGEQSFTMEIICSVLDKNSLCKIEQDFINEFIPFDKNIGYNLSPTAGNTLGIKQSPETCEKKRQNALGNKNPFYGKKHSNETKKIISDFAKIRMTENNPYKGKNHTNEIKEKMRQSKRKFRILCIETRQIFESTGDASRSLGIKVSLISNCIYNQHQSTHGLTFTKFDESKNIDENINDFKLKKRLRKKEINQKLSDIFTKNNPFKGKRHSEELKVQMRISKSKFQFKCNETEQTFYSLRQAEQALKINKKTIQRRIVDGKSTKGFSFSIINHLD